MTVVDCVQLARDIEQAEVAAADFYAGNPAVENYIAREDQLFDNVSALNTAVTDQDAHGVWEARETAQSKFQAADAKVAREIAKLRAIGNALLEAGRLADAIENDLASIEDGDGTDPALIDASLDQLDQARALVNDLQNDWDLQEDRADEADRLASEALRLQEAESAWAGYSGAHSDEKMSAYSPSDGAARITDLQDKINTQGDAVANDVAGQTAFNEYSALRRAVNALLESQDKHCLQ